MNIYKISFPIYGIIIILSGFVGILYMYKALKKENCNNQDLLLYFFMYAVFAFCCGKFYTIITKDQSTNFLSAGLSSYGGLIGAILSAIIFEKILPSENKIVKYSILSLPLIYGLTKIACFITGCCYGIPYDGFLSVTYVSDLNIPLFPIQITETIAFIIIFIICNKYKNKKNITYITMILSAVMKFLLDFLRYDHLTIAITINQIFSIILIVITIIIFIYNKFIFKK